MSLKPFLKWPGGKRWLAERELFNVSRISGRYMEPFLGGGAVFFHHLPKRAVLSDANSRLIETYLAIREHPVDVYGMLCAHASMHSKEYYYEVRAVEGKDIISRAARFLYLNRSCWNGLYRENLAGKFNVPIGTKTMLVSKDDDFRSVSDALTGVELAACDFETTVDRAGEGDFLFVDPPYTTAHNMNGFVKYNQNIFRWSDQLRLRASLTRAYERGASVVVTNADHPSVRELYSGLATPVSLSRHSVIAGRSDMRRSTTEAIYIIGMV